MSISKSDIVISLAGRDKGRLFFVLETDGAFAVIADGKIRKLEHPKRKKLKHLQLAGASDCNTAKKLRRGEAVLDSELRRELAIFGQELSVRTKEDGLSWQKTT